MKQEQTGITFPVLRAEYVERFGNERPWRLFRNKLLGRAQRNVPFARLRLFFLSLLGSDIKHDSAERNIWIATDVYIDDTFPELVTIEAGAVLAVRSMILCHDDGKSIVSPVSIGKKSYIGAGAIILPGVVVGHGAIVGAGAVVTHDIPEGETWAGVPARRI